MVEKWQARVREHYNECIKQMMGNENKVFGVFLYGSQNYGLGTPNSDVDTKAVIVPDLADIATNTPPFSKEYHFDNGEHMVMVDFRLWMQQLRKHNPNTIETLFTEYFVINPIYQKIWESLQDIRQDIVYLNKERFCHAIKGMYFGTYKTCFSQNPSSEKGKEYFEKFGYNPKSLSHMVRLSFLIRDYMLADPIPFEQVLRVSEDEADCLDAVRSGCFITLDLAKEIASDSLEKIDSEVAKAADYLETYSEVEHYYTICDTMNKISITLFKIKLKGEILND